jgi:hypothetical protein
MVNSTTLINTTPKAFNMNNPVQAERSSGYELLPEQELRSSSTRSYFSHILLNQKKSEPFKVKIMSQKRLFKKLNDFAVVFLQPRAYCSLSRFVSFVNETRHIKR